MAKLIFTILAILVVFVVQISVLPSISWFLPRLIFLPLILISFIALLGNLGLAFFVACLLGIILDFYSPYFFGFYTLVFLLVVLVIKFFHLNFLQHKNLSSLLAANIFSLIIFQTACLFYAFFSGSSGLSWRQWLFFFGQVGVHCLLIAIIYFLPGPLGHKMKNLDIA
jgi:hypothetical protein